MKQKFVDKRNENNKFISEVYSKTPSNFKENVVKIVDKSYLEKSFVVGEHQGAPTRRFFDLHSLDFNLSLLHRVHKDPSQI